MITRNLPAIKRMKLTIPLILIAFAAATLNAQPKSTTEADYNGTFEHAVSETNGAFPFVFTVITERFESGKLVSTETDVNERQAQGVAREAKTLKKDGKVLSSYSVMVGFGNYTYCSTDGVMWTGPQKFVCPGPEGPGSLRLYRPRQPDKVEYSVTEESVDGKPVKIYRKYSVFNASGPSGKKDFEEKVATIDSRGFFISVVNTEGTLDPKTVTLIRKQTWDFKTKFKPVVAPK
jgi:hypothetical protein